MHRADAFATKRAAIPSRPQKFCASQAESPGISSKPTLLGWRGNSRIFKPPSAWVRYSRQKALASSQPSAVIHGTSGAPLLKGAAETNVQIIGLQVATGELMGLPVGFAVPVSSFAQQASSPNQ